MSEFAIEVNESKLGFAVLCKCLDLHHIAVTLRDLGLAEFFPDVSIQFKDVCSVLRFGVSAKIAWTGQSMTKADSVPDDTRVPATVEINDALISLMYNAAVAKGITLSESYVFTAVDGEYIEASKTWSGAAKIYLDMMSLADELTMFKIVFGDLYLGTVDINRSPGQVIPFASCPLPLAHTAVGFSIANWSGIKAAAGDYINNLMRLPALDVFALSPGELSTSVSSITVSGVVHPSDATLTIFDCSAGGAIIAVMEAEGSNGVQFASGTWLSGASVRVVVATASAPSSITFTVLTMAAL